jgi:PilZ domain
MSAAHIGSRLVDEFYFEKRSRKRFPLHLEVQYRLLDNGDHRGSARAVNISSTGVLFEVADPSLFVGSIELMVTWPCFLGGVCLLKLVVVGSVVRSEGRRIAIHFTQHEFHTAGPVISAKRRHSKMQTSIP